jgi:hypothetical protein
MAAGNILETFYFLFATDASGVRDGTEEAEKAADRLEQKQGETEKAARKTEQAVKDTGKAAGKTAESFAAMAKRAVAVLLPFAGLAGLKGAVSAFAADADAAGKLASSLNVGIEALQAWQGAAVRAGGSAEGMASSMKSLDGKLREMARGGGGDAGYAFYSLGISARDAQGRMKSADVVLGDLSGKFAGMSRQRALKVGQMLGLDEGTIELLRRGEKGVGELLARQKELGLYSKKDAEEARKFNNVMADMKQAFGAVSAVIMRLLMPVFTAVSEGITTAATGIRRHQNLITGFFIALGAVMAVLAVKTGLAFAPLVIMTVVILAAAAAFAVLYDDVQAFLKGHDSVIGRLSKDYPWLADMVRDIADTFSRLWNIAKAVGTLLVESINDPAAAWEKFLGTIGPDVDALSAKFPELSQAIKDVGSIFTWLFDLVMPPLKLLAGLLADVIGGLAKAAAFVGGKLLRGVAARINNENPYEDEDGAFVDPETGEPIQTGNRAPREETPGPYADLDDNSVMPDAPAQPDAAAPAGTRQEPRKTPAAPSAGRAAPQPGMPETPPSPGLPRRSPPPLPGELPPDTAANLAGAKAALRLTGTPLSSLPSGAAARTTEVHKSTTVNVGTVEVHTQAQDAEGISRDVGSALEAQLRDAADQFDDGVSS